MSFDRISDCDVCIYSASISHESYVHTYYKFPCVETFEVAGSILSCFLRYNHADCTYHGNTSIANDHTDCNCILGWKELKKLVTRELCNFRQILMEKKKKFGLSIVSVNMESPEVMFLFQFGNIRDMVSVPASALTLKLLKDMACDFINSKVKIYQ